MSGLTKIVSLVGTLSQPRRHKARLTSLLRRLAAGIYYLPPRRAAHNPRRQMTTFRSYCTPVSAFPHTADNTSWYLPLRAPEAVSYLTPYSIDIAEVQTMAEAALGISPASYPRQMPEAFLASIHNARILNPQFVVGAPGKIFQDSLWAPWIFERDGLLDKTKPALIVEKPGRYILLGLLWWNYYYHWLLEILPRLELLETLPELADVPLIVPAGMSAMHYEALALAGVPRERLVEYDGGEWHVERLDFPSLLNETLNPSPHAVEWLRRTLMTGADAHSADSTRRLYLSRRDASTRRISNEPALEAMLHARGFQTVCCAELSLGQQIELFQSASLVVGPHGAGLTNMAFAPSHAALVELFPENFINGCYWKLAGVRQQRYAYSIGQSQGADFTVDVDRIAALLDTLPPF